MQALEPMAQSQELPAEASWRSTWGEGDEDEEMLASWQSKGEGASRVPALAPMAERLCHVRVKQAYAVPPLQPPLSTTFRRAIGIKL